MPSRSESLRALADLASELEIDHEAAMTVAESLEALERLQALLDGVRQALGQAGVDLVPEVELEADELLQDPVLLHKLLTQVEKVLKHHLALIDQAKTERARRELQMLVYQWLLATHRTRNQPVLAQLLEALQAQEQQPGLGLAA